MTRLVNWTSEFIDHPNEKIQGISTGKTGHIYVKGCLDRTRLKIQRAIELAGILAENVYQVEVNEVYCAEAEKK